jgi:AraC family transcriptional regulator
LNYLRHIQRGIDFIETHLDEDISSAAVARHAGISHWHFQRIFKALTNETLKTYIRSRRLANALDALSTSNARILDIALAAGFETQASFTRAFKLAFRVTPAEFRRHGGRFQFVRKIRFDADYLEHIHTRVTLEPELYQQPTMQLVGLCTHFFGVDSEKNNMAQKLPALWNSFLARLHEIDHRIEGVCYGVVRQTVEKTDELEYYAAIEVSRIANLPPGMVTVEVSSGQYARFSHVGRVEHFDQTVNYVYSSWLARSGMRHTYGADLELYDDRYKPDADDSLIRYAIPVEADVVDTSD